MMGVSKEEMLDAGELASSSRIIRSPSPPDLLSFSFSFSLSFSLSLSLSFSLSFSHSLSLSLSCLAGTTSIELDGGTTQSSVGE